MASNAKRLPGSLGAELLETYYRVLDEALATNPTRDRRLEEIGDVLPRPNVRMLAPVRARRRVA